jgi:hypothetical protein
VPESVRFVVALGSPPPTTHIVYVALLLLIQVRKIFDDVEDATRYLRVPSDCHSLAWPLGLCGDYANEPVWTTPVMPT